MMPNLPSPHRLGRTPGQQAVPDWLRRAALHYPDRIAIEDSLQSWTFTELDRRATQLAYRLRTGGVSVGDRVALLAGNHPAYSVVVHALTRAGAILVPLNTRLAESELCWQISDSSASLLLYDEAHATRAAGIGAQLPELRCLPLEEQTSEQGYQRAGLSYGPDQQ